MCGDDVAAVVGGAVVDYDHFPAAAVVLTGKRVQTEVDGWRLLVGVNDHGRVGRGRVGVRCVRWAHRGTSRSSSIASARWSVVARTRRVSVSMSVWSASLWRSTATKLGSRSEALLAATMVTVAPTPYSS